MTATDDRLLIAFSFESAIRFREARGSTDFGELASPVVLSRQHGLTTSMDRTGYQDRGIAQPKALVSAG